MSFSATRLDFACAGALSLLTVLSRLPYRARMLYDWDAVQFALALHEYDVVKHQPHPPGYILYVALGRLVNVWLDDPAAAYVVLAVVFSGLTTFVVYFLARTIYDRTTALAAATLLTVSPLFWFYGSVGLTYASEALGASVVAYFAFRALRGSASDAWLAAGYLGLSGGLRQSLLFLLFPLWLGTTMLGVRRARPVGIGLGIVVVAALTWFVPMVWLTGGLQRYLAALLELADLAVVPTTIVVGRPELTLRMAAHLLESILVGLGPLTLVAPLIPWYVRRHGWGRREWFLVGWTATPVLFYILVHFGQAGYALVFLPALVVLLSRVLIAALDAASRAASRAVRTTATVAVVMGVVSVNGSFFVSARPLWRDFDRARPAWAKTAEADVFDWIFSRTAAALREHEDVMQTFVAAIGGLYRPEDTLLITEQGNPRSYAWFRHAMFYLPGYPIYELRVGELSPGFHAPHLAAAMAWMPETEIRVPTPVQRVVWFVDHWNPAAERPIGLEEVELPHGRYLYVLPLGRRPVTYGEYTFVRGDPLRPARAAR